MTRSWTDADLKKLDAVHGVLPDRIVALQLNRTENAVRVMGCRRRKERERVEAARKLRNNPRETSPFGAVA